VGTVERESSGELERSVYEQLRLVAARQMQNERIGHTLTATALVNEAYLKLAPGGLAGEDRARFFRAAAVAMRRILIDHARRRGTAKRAGGQHRARDVQSVLDLAAPEREEDVMALEGALSRLEGEDPRGAELVRLRFYAGLSGDEAAAVLGISARQADREWAYARAYLLRALRSGVGE
jgi:RNA polymerase sigma factor (TIGR02999 family)